MWLITFDIDGTMEFGDPGGVLTREHVDYFRSKGAVIGSASDRPENTQAAMWADYGITVDFTIVKHRMPDLRERYPDAHAYWHVGDRPVDQQIAERAEFTFFWPDQFPSPELAEGFFSQTPDETDDSPTNAEAMLKLSTHALGRGRTNEAIARYDQFASAGRVPGDELGNVLPI